MADPTEGFKELTNSLKEAINSINGQVTLVNALKGQVQDLENRVADIAVRKPEKLAHGNEHGWGFDSVKEAKQFVGMVRGIWNNDPTVKDVVEGVDSEGGYFVKPEYVNRMISLIEVYGLARQQCTVVPMSGTEILMPKLTGGVQTYWVGETKAIGETQPEFGEFRMINRKLAALVPISNEFLEDESINIANLLLVLFAQAFAKREDQTTFMGNAVSGNDPFNGVMYNPDVPAFTLPSGSTSFADVTADDLEQVTSYLPSGHVMGAAWYMHRTVASILRRLKYSGTGEYVWGAPESAGLPPTLWGYPVYLTEVMPNTGADGVSTDFIFFGNMMHYYIGDRNQMSMARSPHFAFNTDRTFLRVIQRLGFEYAIPETGLKVKTAAS